MIIKMTMNKIAHCDDWFDQNTNYVSE